MILNHELEGIENSYSTFKLSQHAALRMAQRNVSLDDLKYVLEYGKRLYRTGITIYILRKIDIPQNDQRKSEITRLEGTIVLTGFSKAGTLEIITIYRNKTAFKVIRGKPKYDRRIRYRST